METTGKSVKRSESTTGESVVLREIQEVRRELDVLKSFLAHGDRADPGSESNVRLNVSFDRRQSDRLPFTVALGGTRSVQLPLSALRTAILLVCLLDLERRSSGGTGLTKPAELIEEVCRALGHADGEKGLSESVRVGLYRAARFFRDSTNVEGCPEIRIDPQTARCTIRHGAEPVDPRRVRVRIVTSDETISRLIDSLTTTSPLARVRHQQAMYVPAGPDGYDLLLHELFSAPGEVFECSMFYRISIQNHPVDLLERYGASPHRLERAKIVQQGYREGRVKFREILNRDSIRDQLFPETDDLGVSPFTRTAEDRVKLAEHVIMLLKTCPTYELVLTDAFLPFYLGTLSLRDGAASEDFVLFFRRDGREANPQVGAFVLNDQNMFRTIDETITAWVLEHPTTIRDRAAVIAELEAFLAPLKTRRPA